MLVFSDENPCQIVSSTRSDKYRTFNDASGFFNSIQTAPFFACRCRIHRKPLAINFKQFGSLTFQNARNRHAALRFNQSGSYRHSATGRAGCQWKVSRRYFPYFLHLYGNCAVFNTSRQDFLSFSVLSGGRLYAAAPDIAVTAVFLSVLDFTVNLWLLSA